MRLSQNFTLAELTRSQAASRLGIANEPDEAAVANLQRLVDTLLQPLRDYLGRPIAISSGYRSPELNRAIGGSKRSDHMVGCAADFTVPGMTCESVIRTIIGRHLPFDQLIDEFGGQWVHVSVPRIGTQPRREFLAAVRDPKLGTVYLPGRLA